MKIVSEFDDHRKKLYTVEIQNCRHIDFLILEATGLIYIMQNADGSLVYDAENSGITFPDYHFDEQKALMLVQEKQRQRLASQEFILQ